jgi:hypothetical protein
MQNESIKPVLLTYGGAEKSSFDMTPEEFSNAAKAILRRVKEKAFYKGLPIYYGKDGNVIAEYADGHTEIVG